jgi:hypothetical protein
MRREVDEQTGEAAYFDARLVRDGRPNELDAFLHREERRLGGVIGDSDDQPIDEFQAAMDEVFVSARDRIEAACIDRYAHERRE